MSVAVEILFFKIQRLRYSPAHREIDVCNVYFIAQRKGSYFFEPDQLRRRSDTVVVSTINYADQGSGDAFRKGSEAPPAPLREIIECLGFGGTMVARLKLKGIDGRAPPGVNHSVKLLLKADCLVLNTMSLLPS